MHYFSQLSFNQLTFVFLDDNYLMLCRWNVKVLFVNKYCKMHIEKLPFMVVLICAMSKLVRCSDKGLYTLADNVTIFSGDTLLPTLTTSPTLWLVEYYSSWCGHCQEFAPVFKALAKDVAGWSWLFRIGSINCGDTAPSGEENYLTCHRDPLWVFDYPEFRFYASHSNASEPGLTYKGPQDINDIRKFIVDYIDENIEIITWSHQSLIKPVLRSTRYDEGMIYLTQPNRRALHTVLIFEEDKSYLGKQVILDTSSCTNLLVRRVNIQSEDGLKLATKFGVISSELPHVVVIANNGSVIPVDVKRKTRHFYTYQLTRLPGVGEPLARIEDVTLQTDDSDNGQQVIDIKLVDRDRVYLADIESAIRYTLTMEVSTVKVIEGKKLEALKSFVDAFVQLGDIMPGRATTLKFMVELSDWLSSQSEVGYERWSQKVKEVQPTSFLPPTNKLWVGCQPSKPTLRRYPCALWTLFHTMSVAAYNAKIPDKALIPDVMAAYITNFFSCRECRINFKKEIKQLPFDNRPEPYSAVLWLWKVHNSVNQRLHFNSSTEDPAFPKVQYPPVELCPSCYTPEHKWNERMVAEFLIKRYSSNNVHDDYLNMTESLAEFHQTTAYQSSVAENLNQSASSVVISQPYPVELSPNSSVGNLTSLHSINDSVVSNQTGLHDWIEDVTIRDLADGSPSLVSENIDMISTRSHLDAASIDEFYPEYRDVMTSLSTTEVQTSSKITGNNGAQYDVTQVPDQAIAASASVTQCGMHNDVKFTSDVINGDWSNQPTTVEMTISERMDATKFSSDKFLQSHSVDRTGIDVISDQIQPPPVIVDYVTAQEKQRVGVDSFDHVDSGNYDWPGIRNELDESAESLNAKHAESSDVGDAAIGSRMSNVFAQVEKPDVVGDQTVIEADDGCENVEQVENIRSVLMEAFVAPHGGGGREKMRVGDDTKLSADEVWAKRLQKVINKNQVDGNHHNRFHPRALGANNLNGKETAIFSGSLRVNMGFTPLDVNLCLMIWFISVVGAFCLCLAYRLRRTLFYRRKNYKHLL